MLFGNSPGLDSYPLQEATNPDLAWLLTSKVKWLPKLSHLWLCPLVYSGYENIANKRSSASLHLIVIAISHQPSLKGFWLCLPWWWVLGMTVSLCLFLPRHQPWPGKALEPAREFRAYGISLCSLTSSRCLTVGWVLSLETELASLVLVFILLAVEIP